ncbi:hypothetical protein P8605_17260 [Streptomyces sp. T-3]|nr:hypothetical protein [Streptomyces sp. T-3]
MDTSAELREALSMWGFPGDRQELQKELASAGLDDRTAVRRITQGYRHRVLMRYNPGALAALAGPTDDVEAEFRRKMAEVGAQGRTCSSRVPRAKPSAS